MGKITRIMITGANGYVGRAAVAEARARNLEVVAVYRRAAVPEWASDPGVFAQQADLSDDASAPVLREAMANVGAVIHAAAHLGDDPARLADDTRRGTQTLLTALRGAEVRLVLVSSIAVYDTMRLQPGSILTENSPLDTAATASDAYSASKLDQEALCEGSGHPVWLIRPGAVYGPGRSWNALLGFWASKLFVQISSEGQLPLVHVSHLAQTLVEAALAEPRGIQALNVVDDDLPTRARFVAAHRAEAGWPRAVVSVPFGGWLALARILAPFSAKLPGLLREPVLRARLMPLRYPNTALRSILGGADSAPFEDMLAISLEGET